MSLQFSRLRDAKWRDAELCLRVFDDLCSALNSADPSAMLRELTDGKLPDSDEHKLVRLALGSRKVNKDRYSVLLGIGVTVPTRLAGANDDGFVKMGHLAELRSGVSAVLGTMLGAENVRVARSTVSPKAMSEAPLSQWCKFLSETGTEAKKWIDLPTELGGAQGDASRKEIIFIEMDVGIAAMCAIATKKHLDWRLSLDLMRVANEALGASQARGPRVACADTLLNAWWRCDVQTAWANIADAVRGSCASEPVIEWSWSDAGNILVCAVMNDEGGVIASVEQQLGLPTWGLVGSPEEVLASAESVLLAERRGVRVQRRVG